MPCNTLTPLILNFFNSEKIEIIEILCQYVTCARVMWLFIV
jgi:hypothetical protein